MASTRLCRNQAFRFKSALFGFQFHFELTEAGIEALLNSDASSKLLTAEQITATRQQTPANFKRYARLGDKLIGNWVQFLKAYQ